MSTPSDDWDQDEQQALTGLEDQLEAIRQRHAMDPPLDLLRAARADVLPPAEQARVMSHLESSEWSRTLVDSVEAGSDPAPLDEADQRRLWIRIARETRAAAAPATAPGPGPDRWNPAVFGSLAVAASLIIAVTVWRGGSSEPAGPAVAPDAVAPAPPAAQPPLAIAFSKPEIKLGPAALTWRGAASDNPYLADLKPAVDAYRAGNDPRARDLFTALSVRYPQAVEVQFYSGVTLMLNGEFDRALAPLAAAVDAGEPVFTEDATWYLAVTEQRTGRDASARSRFSALCSNGGLHAADACVAVRQIDAAPARP